MFAENIVLAAILFKDAAYKNESEIRFLEMHAVGDVPDLKHRARGYRRVPYKVFQWRRAAPGALKSIVIGPAADAPRSEKFVAECLRAANVPRAT